MGRPLLGERPLTSTERARRKRRLDDIERLRLRAQQARLLGHEEEASWLFRQLHQLEARQ